MRIPTENIADSTHARNSAPKSIRFKASLTADSISDDDAFKSRKCVRIITCGVRATRFWRYVVIPISIMFSNTGSAEPLSE